MANELEATELARMIDISAVQTFHDITDVAELARVARSYGFIAAHVLPGFVPLLKEQLDWIGHARRRPSRFSFGRKHYPDQAGGSARSGRGRGARDGSDDECRTLALKG